MDDQLASENVSSFETLFQDRNPFLSIQKQFHFRTAVMLFLKRHLSDLLLLGAVILISSGQLLAQIEVDVFPESADEPAEASKVDSIVEAALQKGEVGYDTTQYRKRKYRLFNPLLNLDNHRSGFFDVPTSIWGLKIGVTIAKRYRMGFGGYMLPKKLRIPDLIQVVGTDTTSTLRKFDFVYFSTFMEFVPLSNFRWELSIPFSLGYGFANIEHLKPGDSEYKLRHNRQGILLHSGISAHYKVFSWVGVGVGLGFRQALTPDSVVNEAISGLFASFKFKIFLGDLYFAIFKPDIIKGEKMAFRDKRRRKKDLDRARKEARRAEKEAARNK